VPHTIAEADWKVLRRVHPLALERYSENVLAEIERVTQNSAQNPHQRYLDIFKIIERRDREIASIFNDLKRSNALTMLARMRAAGLLTEAEFFSLSPETRSAIELLLAHGESSVWRLRVGYVLDDLNKLKKMIDNRLPGCWRSNRAFPRNPADLDPHPHRSHARQHPSR